MPSPKASTKPTSPADTHKRVRRVVAGDRKSETGSRTTTLVASPDSRTIYYQQGGSIQTIRTRSGEHDKRKLVVPPDSKFAVSPKDSKQVLVWSLTSAAASVTSSPTSPVSSPPPRKFVKLVNFETGQTLMSLAEEACSGARDLTVTPDWKRVVLLDDHGVTVYRLDDGQHVGGSPRSTEAAAPVFSCIAALNDNQHVAVAQAERNVIMIWNIQQAKTVKTLEGPPGSELLGHLQVSDDDGMLLGLSRSGAFFWDLEARRLVKSIEVGAKEPGSSLFAPLKVSLSADWKWMTVRADFGHVIKFYEVAKGELVASFSDHNTTMNASTLTPDLRFLITMDHVTPDTLTTGRVFMTFWDVRKILKDKWDAHRGSFHGSKSKDGRRNGYGKCFFLDKSTYDGEWVNDDRHGHGKHEYRDGSVYDGDWAEDERAGTGRCNYPDHSRYEGEWSQDGREGQGTCWYADGSRYQGAWRDDRRHGEGEHRSSFGSRYRGDWRHDRREGHGVVEYTDGSKYDGVWQRDEWHGRGVLYGADKTRYEGEFRRGRREGHGKLFNAQGGIEYDGHWHDNLRHGHGKEFGAHGVVLYDGQWVEGVRAAMHKQGGRRSLTDMLSPSKHKVEHLQLKGHGKASSGGRAWVWLLLALVLAVVAAVITVIYLRDYQVELSWDGMWPRLSSTGQCHEQANGDGAACVSTPLPWEQLWR